MQFVYCSIMYTSSPLDPFGRNGLKSECTRLHSRRNILTGAAAALLLGARGAHAAEPVTITGAGSSFIDPVVRRWLELIPDTLGVKASYDPVGSGNGRNRILAGDVDFGASD
jgi:phosphate transport system substrate-binding protein